MQHKTFLRIKAAEGSDGERWITAWATTPSEDLVGDVVDPAGAVYELPVPLLAYHKHDQPVGAVTEAHVTERGIRVRAKLSKGVQLADELWTLIKDGAVNAVSIGFRALKSKPLPGGGLKYERWRWLELSLTPIPANPDATIITVGKMMAYGGSGETVPAKAEPTTLEPYDPEVYARDYIDLFEARAAKSKNAGAVHHYTGREREFVRLALTRLFEVENQILSTMAELAQGHDKRLKALEGRDND